MGSEEEGTGQGTSEDKDHSWVTVLKPECGCFSPAETRDGILSSSFQVCNQTALSGEQE